MRWLDRGRERPETRATCVTAAVVLLEAFVCNMSPFRIASAHREEGISGAVSSPARCWRPRPLSLRERFERAAYVPRSERTKRLTMHSVLLNARFLVQPVTGVERFAREMAHELRQRCSSVELLVPTGATVLPPVSGPLQRYGVLRGQPWEQLELGRYARCGGRVLVNLGQTAPLRATRQMVTIHDLAVFHEPRWFTRRFRSWHRFLLRRLAREAARIVTLSEFSRGEIVKYLGVEEDRVSIVPGAVASQFLHASRPAVEGERSFDFASARPFVLTVSSRSRRKNLRRLLLAYQQLARADVDLFVVGVSKRDLVAAGLGALMQKASGVHALGRIEDAELASLYGRAVAFVYPSLYEGFALSPLEAMAGGCPVVTSNIAALTEVCGAAAEYVDPNDIDSIASGLRTVLDSTRRAAELQQLGLERARAFSWEKSGAEFAAIVREIVCT